MLILVWTGLFLGSLLAGEAGGQEAGLQKEADPPRNCSAPDRARKGDKVIMEYIGLLSNGTTFDRGQSEFVLGEGKVIAGWEQGMEGGCAGEKITLIVPPELGYGDSPSDKVTPGSTLYFITQLQGIIRTTKPPPGGECHEGQKARPNIDVTLDIEGRVSQPDGKGDIFLDKPSLEIRFGSPDAIRFIRGLEAGLTGACTEEERTLILGPDLAYGAAGKSDGKVKGDQSVRVEARVVRVRDKKPEDQGLVLSFLDTIADGKLKNFSG